jgi:hypothetical protein
MRTMLGLALMGALTLPCSSVWAQPYSQRQATEVDVGAFYDGLAPYGDWVEMPDYGWSWSPRVEPGWRPYTRGQWLITEDGWFWDSDETFGWAAYHYGRWANDPYYGWLWVPGNEWAPAWVSWRHGNGYIGWAPLPPRASWQTSVGFTMGGLDIDAFIDAGDYAFVQDRAFVDRGLALRVLPPRQNVTIINATSNVTYYTVVNQRVVNGGVAVGDIEQAVGRRLTRARTFDVDRADAPRRATANEVAVFRPQVKVAPERRPAQGKSLVKGDEAPARLVERRKVREQERQQKGNEPVRTTRDVEQQRSAGHPRDEGRETARETQQRREQAQDDADKRFAKGQVQQAADEKEARQGARREQNKVDAKAQADKRVKDTKEAKDTKEKDSHHDKGKKNPKASPTPPPPDQQP